MLADHRRRPAYSDRDGADYCAGARGRLPLHRQSNQKGVAQNVQQLYQSLSHAFPPQVKTTAAQTCERNRSRTEARCLIPLDTTAQATAFPFLEQAARLTRCCDSQKKPAQGIETGLHLRLDVSAGEDRSRVRNRTSAFNLAMMRPAVISVAVCWIKQCPNPRKATLSGFFDAMSAKQSQKTFSLVTTRYSRALSCW
jgi:hypothetical protein